MNAEHATDRRVLYFVFIALFALTRLIYFEADIPRYAVTGYSPLDEMYYTQMSFELNEHTRALENFDISEDFEARSLAETYLTAATLWIFGDNYYGVRMPSVLAGLLVLFLCLHLVIRRFGIVAAALFGVFLIVEPGFILATRVAEPTILRLAAMCVVMAYPIQTLTKTKPLNAFVLGLLSGIMFLFVYPQNAFLALAGLVTALVFAEPGKRWAASFRYAVGGLLSIAIFAAAVLSLFSWQSLVDGFALARTMYSYRVGAGNVVAGIHLPFFLFNGYMFRAATFFRLNRYFEVLTLLLLVYLADFLRRRIRPFSASSVKRIWSEASVIDRIVVIYFLSLLAQTLVVNDFPYRKLPIAFPFFLYFIFSAFEKLAAHPIRGRRVSPRLMTLILLPAIAIDCLRSGKLIYAHPAFEYKRAMESLAPLGPQYAVGAISSAFRLYNDFHTYLKPYRYVASPRRKSIYENHLASVARLNRDVYSLDYETPESDSYYARIGFNKVRRVMETNDPTNVDAPVALYKNRR